MTAKDKATMQSTSRFLICLVTLLGSPSTCAHAQAQIEPSQAQSLFAKKYTAESCIAPQIGTFVEPHPLVAKHIRSWEKVGVLRVVSASPSRLVTEFTGAIDNKSIRELNGRPCVLTTSSLKDVVVAKIEHLKGGRTNWDAAIAYLHFSVDQRTPLFEQFDENLGHSFSLNGNARVLFKRDPFKGDWALVTFDKQVPHGTKFMSHRVPDALTSD